MAKIYLKYFTDPVCSTCWISSNMVRKFLNHYGHHLKTEQHHGGLLKTWQHYKECGGKITGPEELAHYWTSEAISSGINIDGDFWLENPLNSSHPIALACYAVQIIAPDKSEAFLRKMQELLFLHKINTSNLSLQVQIAGFFDISQTDFLTAINSKSCTQAFNNSIRLRNKLGIKQFPSFVLESENKQIILGADATFETLEQAIYELDSDIKPKSETPTVHKILRRYPYLSTVEIQLLLNSSETSTLQQLNNLKAEGIIQSDDFKYGQFWSLKTYKNIDVNRLKNIPQVSILGGGIAGLGLAINLQKKGINSMVFEKMTKESKNGFGFILMDNGIDILKKMGLWKSTKNEGVLINSVKNFEPGVKSPELTKIPMALGISREAFINILKSSYDVENIVYNKNIKDLHKGIEGNYCLMEFTDDTLFAGDFIVAADGANSYARTLVSDDDQVFDLPECEIVGFAESKELCQLLGNSLWKIQDKTKGINIGLLPCGKDKITWFVQLNLEKNRPIEHGENLLLMAAKIAENYQAEFRWAIGLTNAQDTYLWKMKEVPMLETYCKNNLMLIGDAAHPLLSLSSQGVSMALEDAYLLSFLLPRDKSEWDIDKLGKQFYDLRKERIQLCMEGGKKLLENFLHPTETSYIPMVRTPKSA